MQNVRFEGEELIEYEEQANKTKYYLVFKRVFDVILSILGLICLSPVFLIITIIIKFDSKGSVFFKHKRVGKHGELINVYKFRTMYQNSKEIFENLPKEKKQEFEENFKLDNDPRITSVGNILRKTSLDELPQLINILVGNMTIVGPRPVIERELQKYGNSQRKLLSVTPGLTGYWQVNGRSNVTYDDRVKMDMYYIDNRSLKLDMIIILKTFSTVLKKSGAK